MFSLDTESGFRDVVFVTGAYGLGENVVQGAVDPDEFYVHKPTFEQGHRAVLRRLLGDKAVKMIFVEGETQAHHPQHPDAQGRPRALLPRRRRRPRAGRLRDQDRAPLRPTRWTWSGPRTGSTASSTSSRRGPRRSPPSARDDARELRPRWRRRGPDRRPRGRARRSPRARRIDREPGTPARSSSPARCWSRTPRRRTGSR